MTQEYGFDRAGAVVHIVDDDEAIRDSLQFLFSSRGLKTRVWDSGEAFLNADAMAQCTCIIMDMRLGALSGLATFERYKAAGGEAPVIFLTGHADVPVAVEALKKGAFDFVEKPFNDNALVDTIIKALEKSYSEANRSADRSAIDGRMASLTQRELEVLDHLLAGHLNKQIAHDLGVTMRTVEVHRSRVFEKMGVRNAVELANLLPHRHAAK
jgi:two-component system, LuxR family, response regulator DctR